MLVREWSLSPWQESYNVIKLESVIHFQWMLLVSFWKQYLVFRITQSYWLVSVLDDQDALSYRDKDFSVLAHGLAVVWSPHNLLLYWAPVVCSLVAKWVGHEVGHSPACCTKFRNKWPSYIEFNLVAHVLLHVSWPISVWKHVKPKPNLYICQILIKNFPSIINFKYHVLIWEVAGVPKIFVLVCCRRWQHIPEDRNLNVISHNSYQ